MKYLLIFLLFGCATTDVNRRLDYLESTQKTKIEELSDLQYAVFADIMYKEQKEMCYRLNWELDIVNVVFDVNIRKTRGGFFPEISCIVYKNDYSSYTLSYTDLNNMGAKEEK